MQGWWVCKVGGYAGRMRMHEGLVCNGGKCKAGGYASWWGIQGGGGEGAEEKEGGKRVWRCEQREEKTEMRFVVTENRRRLRWASGTLKRTETIES